MFTSGIAEWHQAAGHGLIMQFIVNQFTCQYGTGAAIALAATDLGSGQMLVITYKIQQHHSGRQAGTDFFFVEDKAYQCNFITCLKVSIIDVMKPVSAALPSLIYYRLIALWVLSEAMLGGIIFGLRIPVSGLVVGSCAVICISLIAWYEPVKGAIIKATIIVAIFKMMLSPQAPPAAYFAVLFQGLLGEALYWNRRWFRLATVVLAVLALLESAVQRILVLTIIYGNGGWRALNGFVNNLTGQDRITDYSYYIITWYILAHLVAGLIVGLWAGNLPVRIQFMSLLLKQYPVETGTPKVVPITVLKTRKRRRSILFLVWIILLLLYVQSFFHIGKPLLPPHISLRILVRSVIIVLGWYFLVGPLLRQALNRWLEQKKKQSQVHIQKVFQLLPATKGLITASWKLSGKKKGWARVVLCSKIILANTFSGANA